MWHSLVLSVPYRRAREKTKHSTFRIKMNSRPSPSEGHTHIYNQPHNVTSSLFFLGTVDFDPSSPCRPTRRVYRENNNQTRLHYDAFNAYGHNLNAGPPG